MCGGGGRKKKVKRGQGREDRMEMGEEGHEERNHPASRQPRNGSGLEGNAFAMRSVPALGRLMCRK